MFGPCPVVRIKHDNPDGFVEINEADFDPDRHALFEVRGDGSGEAMPELPESAYAPDAKPSPVKRPYNRKPKG